MHIPQNEQSMGYVQVMTKEVYVSMKVEHVSNVQVSLSDSSGELYKSVLGLASIGEMPERIYSSAFLQAKNSLTYGPSDPPVGRPR